jgi:hypothetical protein
MLDIKELKPKYDKIIKELDFVTIKEVMLFLKWKWFSEEGPPTIERMKRHCDIMYDLAVTDIIENPEEEYYCYSSGGFEVMVFVNDIDEYEMEIKFIISQGRA